ncbi:MAG: choice-of-anchor Q domain-containing protein [Dokdonella sp.]|uniref:choice-of-anchor Q domain-containing protein n=1 Tax=Dokdonella sp. TaxID=2291710 RepID=UPI0032640793
MNAFDIATSRHTSAPFAIASECATPCDEAVPHTPANHSRAAFSKPCITPLALALALALAVGTSVAADRASGSNTATPRPDGSILWVVENCNDSGAGSLRDAATHANHGDGIDLGSLACSTISVTSGAMTLHDVELVGPGAAQLEINGTGNQGRRIFNHVGAGGHLDISGVTISGATYVSNASLGGGCLRSDGGNLNITDSVFRSCAVVTPVGQDGYARGGAIAVYGDGDVLLQRTTIASNIARTDHQIAAGGGLYAQGNVFIYKSTITNNWVSSAAPGSGLAGGGGLLTNGSAWIEDSTLDGNLASRDGGAAWVAKGGVLVRSTVSNNIATTGTSGVVMLGRETSPVFIISSTFSGNVSEQSAQEFSGALYVNAADTTVTNCTITGNSETNQVSMKFGAGIVFGPGVVNASMTSTIAAGNYFDDGKPPFAADDIDAPASLTILGDTNIVGWTHRPVPADTIFESQPGLGPLQDNGGPTRTHLPLSNSPVIDHGAAHSATIDQRGLPRVVGAAADIGAVETNDDGIFADGFE